MSTIIERVNQALRATNKPYDDQLADELLKWAKGLRDTSERLLENYRKQAATMRQLIHVVQARCPHHEWYLGATNDELNPGTWGPEDTIVCHNCGHTVCDERAYAFGKRVKQGDYFIYSKANGRRFGLTPDLRKRLANKLNAKEIPSADILKETLRAGGKGDSKEQATGGAGDAVHGRQAVDAGEGCAMEERRGDAG